MVEQISKHNENVIDSIEKEVHERLSDSPEICHSMIKVVYRNIKRTVLEGYYNEDKHNLYELMKVETSYFLSILFQHSYLNDINWKFNSLTKMFVFANAMIYFHLVDFHISSISELVLIFVGVVTLQFLAYSSVDFLYPFRSGKAYRIAVEKYKKMRGVE